MSKYESGDVKYVAFVDHVASVLIVQVGAEGWRLKRRVRDAYVVHLTDKPGENFVIGGSELFDNPVEASRHQLAIDDEEDEDLDEDEEDDSDSEDDEEDEEDEDEED